MIRNQWYVVLESREVKPGKVLGVTRMGEKLVFWRDSQGKVICTGDRCPHLGAPLSMGKVVDGHLACPFHGFEYDSSGQCCYLPAYGKQGVIPKAMKAFNYETYENEDWIWIYWGEAGQRAASPPFFDSLANAKENGFSYLRFQQHWNVHYSRVVENQLDVMHLPFVHATTIGRGGRMVVDGPLVRLYPDDLMDIWVYNRYDDGTPPRRMEELPEPTRHPFLQFRFPNMWQNWISDDVRIMIAFVPVDEENTILYGRYYQRFLRIPLLRDIVNLPGKWGSMYIANQDRQIVSGQIPKKSDLRIGEKITQSDRAILTYRQRRRALKDAQSQTD